MSIYYTVFSVLHKRPVYEKDEDLTSFMGIYSSYEIAKKETMKPNRNREFRIFKGTNF